MGKLVNKGDGYYILEVKIGALTIKKAFKDSDKSLKELENLPDGDEFYLYIPDK